MRVSAIKGGNPCGFNRPRLPVQPIEPARTSCPLVHLGVAIVCGIPPGTIDALVSLPLFMSNPCPLLPGSVVVSIEPR
jgi:hypothetical protein